ncbi:unnamed protein product, partial [marine sediment metagenome]
MDYVKKTIEVVRSINPDILLKIKIDREADPLNMLATSSTAVILAVFDAIIILMMYQENYKKEQFAVIHP